MRKLGKRRQQRTGELDFLSSFEGSSLVGDANGALRESPAALGGKGGGGIGGEADGGSELGELDGLEGLGDNGEDH